MRSYDEFTLLETNEGGQSQSESLSDEVAFNFNIDVIHVFREVIPVLLISIRKLRCVITGCRGSTCLLPHAPWGRSCPTGRCIASARLGHVPFAAAFLAFDHPPLSRTLFLRCLGTLGSCRCPSNTSA